MPERQAGEWINHGTVDVPYTSWWITLTLDDVERPDGTHTRYEVVRPLDAAGMVVVHPGRGILMIWRHRFMPGTWGWEIPGGAVEADEDPGDTAARECLEETGWAVRGPVSRLNAHHPSSGIMSQTMTLYLAGDATFEGAPADVNEAATVEWRSFADVAADVRDGRICDGFSLLGVQFGLAASGLGHWLAPPA